MQLASLVETNKSRTMQDLEAVTITVATSGWVPDDHLKADRVAASQLAADGVVIDGALWRAIASSRKLGSSLSGGVYTTTPPA